MIENTEPPILDAIDGEPVTVLPAERHVVLGSGPGHRQALVYLAVSSARQLAADLLEAADVVEVRQ
jgi:hypothetical protein